MFRFLNPLLLTAAVKTAFLKLTVFKPAFLKPTVHKPTIHKPMLLPRLNQLFLLSLVLPALSLAQTVPACTSTSTAQVTPLLELFTSEGCDSCPPADRWLSTLRTGDNLNIMAWHVDYWDKLGWKDRFALPEAAQRQARLLRALGSRNAYTPQTMVQGVSIYHQPAANVERKLATLSPQPSPIRLQISQVQHMKGVLKVDLNTLAMASGAYQTYVALIENKLTSTVTAGENKGVTLKHDHVVRAWAGFGNGIAKDKNVSYSQTLSIPKDAVPSQLSLVVWAEDERGLPVQSLASRCGL